MSAHPLRFKQPNRQAVARVLAQQAAGLDNHAENITHAFSLIEALAQAQAAHNERLNGLDAQVKDANGDLTGGLTALAADFEDFTDRSFWGRLRWLFTGK